MNARMRQVGEGAAGDPNRSAQILIALAKRDEIPDNLPLGVNATEMSVAQDRCLLEANLRWGGVSRLADFGEPFPVEFPQL
ncbi:hypothetical protein APR04_000103 [Promicromonospora umidemergens]|nr:hypothetical protein [Promicromonospora umidemergens]MCP2281214.1 hypothetical protein [Promicromonospora umidemergens]